jgi:hypothetical protein
MSFCCARAVLPARRIPAAAAATVIDFSLFVIVRSPCRVGGNRWL